MDNDISRMNEIYEKFDIMNKKGEPLSDDFMLDYMDYLIAKYKLSNYVQNIYFDDTINSLGKYNFKRKSIKINPNEIIVNELEQQASNLINDDYQDMYKLNIMLLNTINHEITHATQYKYLLTKKNVYAHLLRESFNMIQHNRELYKINHDKFLIEHHAIVSAYLKSLEFIGNENPKMKDILKEQKRLFIISQYYDTGIYASPYEYIHVLTDTDAFDFKNGIISIPSEESINYGLPMQKTKFIDIMQK